MFVSVIVPVHNGSAYLDRTLGAIRRSQYQEFELIVVDDASTDGSKDIAGRWADAVVVLDKRSSPGVARNRGAAASKGDVLFFIDADVEVNFGTLSRLAREFEERVDLSALFGSYDDEPLEKGFFSQFKNLFHHFVHQTADHDAGTFWAGCGAVRRGDFFKAGGFPEFFRTSAIEDVVLGYSMRHLGMKIGLIKDLTVKHLKKWSFRALVGTDIFQRALPWTRLAATYGLPLDLNFRLSARLSALSVWGLLVSLFLAEKGSIPTLVFSFALLVLNRDLYLFFLHKRGVRFAVYATLFHWFYLLYSSLIFVFFLPLYRLLPRKQPRHI